MEKETKDPLTEPVKQPRRNAPKRKGEVAEAAFLARATELGFEVAKPWGDSSRFDFILHSGQHCWRVQVKSVTSQLDEGYRVKATGHHATYTKEEIDFIVAYIVPEHIWYVIPIEALEGRARVWFFPHRRRGSRFEIYREAWCLMACPRDGECCPEILVRRGCVEGARKCRFGK
jgi:hypothetical protein